MRKGFTLIELLAVIVILAIIALIATPIILGIINDARKESNERSAELYASAVRNAIASYQLTHPNAPTKFADLDIQYDGEVECAKEELYKDGSFYIAECTVNGYAVDYTYGTKKYEPQYYSWSSGNIGGALPSDAKTNALELGGRSTYIGFDVDNDNSTTAVYSCFVRNDIEYCLKAFDTEAYNINTNIIKNAYADVYLLDGVCTLNLYIEDMEIYYSSCLYGDLRAVADSNGFVQLEANDESCWIEDDLLMCS